MKLIFVESPTKARTLTRFLGDGYRVEATMGHIRDLPKSALGVDVDHGFMPTYGIPQEKKKRVSELVALAKAADEVILASDPDREGEAIAWHVAEILRESLKAKKTKKTDVADPVEGKSFTRISFHEITESAINEALSHPGIVDMHLVDAQQARRILDRLVGYKLSPLLWQKLGKRWLSAGRVQSVAVRLIVEREREIEKFVREPYYTIAGIFDGNGDKKDQITANLISHDGTKYESTITLSLFDGEYSTTKTSIESEGAAASIVADFANPFTVKAVDSKTVHRAPGAPFTTSTLQQDAGRRLYFSAKKTMQVAQKLYEEGFITYHRTDSVNLADKFVSEVRGYIKETYGDAYVPDVPKKFQTKSKVAQEAHEAIRPTDVKRTAEDFVEGGGELNHDHKRLYELIWKRSVASQVKEAVFESTSIQITSSNGYLFTTQGSVVVFDGYLIVMGRESGEGVLPKVTVGDTVSLVKTDVVSHESSPPPRYTEASLVKALEEKDIGRPSTYAPIISTIVERQYVKKEDKKLFPTELGGLVTDFLVSYFPDVMSLPFTARMEGKLDEVANGTSQWPPIIEEFFSPFSIDLAKAYENAGKVKLSVEQLEEACPDCKSPLVLRTGRYGKFVACSAFPKCRYTRQYGETVANVVCPKCGGAIVSKRSKKGKTFYGCSNYPTCTFAAWKKEDIK